MSAADLIREGLSLHQASQVAAAASRYRAALAEEPDAFDALHLLGIAELQLGRPAEAAALIERAIAAAPDIAAAHVNLAAARRALGERETALASYGRALALDPSLAEVQFNRGSVLMELGRPAEALSAFDAAIALEPELMEAHNDRAAALQALGRRDEALAGFEAAIALQPQPPQAHSNRAALLNELERPDEAARACETAIALAPDYASAWHNLGVALLKLEQPEAALGRFDEAVARAPEMADAHNGRGLALYGLRRPAEALAAYDAALALAPDDAQAHFNRAAARLALGDLPGGFADYEWRWRLPNARLKRPELPCPLWRGEDLAGKRLLIHCEQGFGDALQFVRLAGPLAAAGARVTVRADPALVRLFRSIPGIEVASDYDPAEFDYHLPMLDLPAVLGTTLTTIPGETPYLATDPNDARQWAARLAADGPGLRVGLVWAGKSRAHDPAAFAIDRRRSLALARLAPLGAVTGARFYSLQLGVPATEAELAPFELIDHTADLNDFTETAALVANLDLVISVDTAVAHLAGALARPVWILSRFDGCWRWLNGRESSPWYPTARVFHQRVRGDWDEVIARVAGELAGWASDRIP